jgi:holo-ACP synthase
LENKKTKETFVIPVLRVTKKMTKELYEELQNYREKKCLTIENLHNLYGQPVISIRANYPGIFKNNETTRLVNTEIRKTFDEFFHNKILAEESFDTPEGPTTFYVLRGDARTLKENAVYIEQNHELGRFVDIDVYDIDEEYAITRFELHHEPRKCFLCDRSAKECSRDKTHPVEELSAFMEERVNEYLMNKNNATNEFLDKK